MAARAFRAASTICSIGLTRTGRRVAPAWQNRQPFGQPRMISRITRSWTASHTGTSGLAGGDHLHFDVLISGQQVNPIEWWDTHWIKDNVTDKLVLAGVTVSPN